MRRHDLSIGQLFTLGANAAFMAEQLSTQMAEGYRKYPIDDHGKLRFMYSSVVVPAAGAYAANDTIILGRLPPGRKRILPTLSRISTSAWGAARTLDIGHKKYVKSNTPYTEEADDVDAFLDGLDVSAAVNAAVLAATIKFDMFSTTEVTVYATILGGTMPVAATLQLLLAYIYE